MRDQLWIDYKQFDELADKLTNDFMASVRPAFDDYLMRVAEYTHRRLHIGMKKHYRTGRTEGSIMDSAHPVWSGDFAVMNVGFDLQDGGIASIFLLYGTPRMKPDKYLHNAIFGSGAKRKRIELGKKAFEDALARLMK